MHARGILSLPDFIVNAGGVICAAVEYRGGSQAQAFTAIEERIRVTTRDTLERARERGLLPRQAASEMVRDRIAEAARYRRR
jgi:glutamate dehydrogenase/leucine dehydrogenase